MTYNLGDYVSYNGYVWKSLKDNNSTVPEAGTDWIAVAIADELQTLHSKITESGTLSFYNNQFNLTKYGNMVSVNFTTQGLINWVQGEIIATLPVGWRPLQRQRIVNVNGSWNSYIDIDEQGVISMVGTVSSIAARVYSHYHVAL